MKRYSEALADFARCMQLEPNSAEISNRYYGTLLEFEKYQKSFRRKLGWYVLTGFISKLYRTLFISCPKKKIQELIQKLEQD